MHHQISKKIHKIKVSVKQSVTARIEINFIIRFIAF